MRPMRRPRENGTTAAARTLPIMHNWTDAQLSQELPVLRSRGEGQTLEYMARYPENARELGKEIAAFATTNAGLILLGVSDDGDLIGLPGLDTTSARDGLVKRIEGI